MLHRSKIGAALEWCLIPRERLPPCDIDLIHHEFQLGIKVMHLFGYANALRFDVGGRVLRKVLARSRKPVSALWQQVSIHVVIKTVRHATCVRPDLLLFDGKSLKARWSGMSIK